MKERNVLLEITESNYTIVYVEQPIKADAKSREDLYKTMADLLIEDYKDTQSED